MNEPIKIGDLVIVVRACCDALAKASHVFGLPSTVTGFDDASVRCPFCGWTGNITRVAFGIADFANRDWVKRIPPLEELDDVTKDEEIHV